MTLRRAASSILLGLTWASVAPAGQAVELLGAPTIQAAADKQDKPARRKAAAAATPVLPGGSGESAAQRSARLKRECKGRPSAGACTGYTD